MAMKLKTEEVNGKQYAVLLDGKPVYILDDGKEEAVDANALTERAAHLQSEARNAFTARDEAKAKLRAFDGMDADKARSALDVVSKLDQKKLIDAGKVDEVRAEVEKSFKEQVTTLTSERDNLTKELYNERIGGRFARSSLIVGDKATVAIPADMVQAKFGNQFKMEDGKVVPYDLNGNKIYSKKTERAGELADFDEALGIMIDAYPGKASILKGAGGQGGGGNGNRGGGGDGKTMTRTAFEGLSPAERAKFSQQPGAQVIDG